MIAEVGEHVGAIRCPKCGRVDRFRLIADVECSHRIYGLAHGFVEVDGHREFELDALGSSFRFECKARLGSGVCDHRWPVPEWVVARLVFYF